MSGCPPAPIPYVATAKTILTGDINPANDQVEAEIKALNYPGWFVWDSDPASPLPFAWAGGNGGLGQEFEPPVYPTIIDSVKVCVGTNTAVNLPIWFIDDDGPDGGPGTVLYADTIPISAGAFSWHTIFIPPTCDTIREGKFYVGVVRMESDSFLAMAVDTTWPHSRRSWEYTGVWAPFRLRENADIMIRAFGRAGPPGAPIDLRANGSSPSPWTNDTIFVINWINPSHPGDIVKARYKLGSPPTGNNDTTGSMSGTPPDTVFSSVEGALPLYVWLEDIWGNTEYTCSSSVDLRYDITPPTGSEAFGLDSSKAVIFQVKWTAGTDTLSGVSGRYDVKADSGTGWYYWLQDTLETFAYYAGRHGNMYYFEAASRDSATNVEIFTGVAECSTFVDTTLIDTVAPEPPENLTADGSSPSPWTNDSAFVINWINPLDMSGIDRALYKLGSAPTSNDDTTGSISGIPTDTVYTTIEGIQPLYLWLVDGSGNVDYNNNASVDLRYDATPPAAPESLYANDCIVVTPWTNGSVFVIRYVESDSSTKGGNPTKVAAWFPGVGEVAISPTKVSLLQEVKGDTSGIDKALYKLFDSPSSNYDTTGTDTAKPFNVVCIQEGRCTVFVWLKDVAGNLSYGNNGWVILRYDKTPPLIDSTTVWHDTFAFWGPFDVRTKITDNGAYLRPEFFFRTSADTNWVCDTMIPLGGGWFISWVPAQTPTDSLRVDYYITDADSASNTSREPHTRVYSFMIYLTGIEEMEMSAPNRFVLFSPAPNPAGRDISIRYGLPTKTRVSLKLYDVSGRFVKSIYSGMRKAGYYSVDIECKKLGRGIYFIRFEAGDYKDTKKLILLR